MIYNLFENFGRMLNEYGMFDYDEYTRRVNDRSIDEANLYDCFRLTDEAKKWFDPIIIKRMRSLIKSRGFFLLADTNFVEYDSFSDKFFVLSGTHRVEITETYHYDRTQKPSFKAKIMIRVNGHLVYRCVDEKYSHSTAIREAVIISAYLSLVRQQMSRVNKSCDP